MDDTIKFLFYLAAVVFFLLAGGGTRWRRKELDYIAIGLALFVFPTLWDFGEKAF